MAGSKAGLDGPLRPLLLDGVEETGEEIGKGSYGTVCKVRRWGMVFAAKKFHSFPHISSADRASRSFVADFREECQLLSGVRHPFIVQFLGVYLDSGRPAVVMDYLPSNLAKCLQDRPQIPRFLQLSILRNVSLGLTYLHGHTPPIIHRDITARNILLTSNMVAKIGDLGIARILELSSRRKSNSLSPPPPQGSAAYMPPEVLTPTPSYSTKVDSFSFGVLIVHLVSQTCPVPEDTTRVVAGGKSTVVTEAARRQKYLDLMGMEHCLLPLVLQCLQNDAHLRPEAADITSTLEVHQRKYPVPSTSYLDLLHVLEINRNQLEAKGVQLEANKEQLEVSVCVSPWGPVKAQLLSQWTHNCYSELSFLYQPSPSVCS